WRIGGTASLASTATGAVFLAFGPQDAVWKQLAAELKEAGLSSAAPKKRVREVEARAAGGRGRGVAAGGPVGFAGGGADLRLRRDRGAGARRGWAAQVRAHAAVSNGSPAPEESGAVESGARSRQPRLAALTRFPEQTYTFEQC